MDATSGSSQNAKRDALLARWRKGRPKPEAVPIRSTEAKIASFAQERFLFMEQLHPGTAAYHCAWSARLSGGLSVGSLQWSIERIVDRHEAFRSTFVLTDSTPLLSVSNNLDAKVTLVDLSDLSVASRFDLGLRLAKNEARKSFDLAKGPLFRVVVVRLAPSDNLLLFLAHHSIFDGTSLEIFFKELSTLYEAHLQRRQAVLPSLPIQYSDFARSQRLEATLDRNTARLDYWKTHLGTEDLPLALTTDRPRPALLSLQGRTIEFSVDQELLTQFRELCREEGVTTFMATLATLYVVLHRYTGQSTITIGCPIANRDTPGTENLVGAFINVLPLRILLEGLSFRSLLQQVKRTTIATLANQHVPFEVLADSLSLPRDRSRTPLFQVMIAARPSATKLHLKDAVVQPFLLETGYSQYELTLGIEQTKDAMALTLEYSTDLFERETAEQIARCITRVMRAVALTPDARISALPVLAAEDMQKVLSASNGVRRPYQLDTCLHGMIEAQVRRTPQAIAVSIGDASLTYAELDDRAERLAGRLQRLGVGADIPVALFAERSLAMVVAILGVLKAGGAYVPLDPDYPKERVAFMLADIQPPVLVSHASMLNQLPQTELAVVILNDDGTSVDFPATEVPLLKATSADNLAYIIYTSGSTGRPKGVMNCHRAVVNRLLWMQEAYKLTGGDRVLQKTPYSFDVSVWEFIWPLIAGARLVLLPPGAHRDPHEIIRCIVAREVTTAHFVPSMLESFLGEAGVEQCTSLTRIICSGEALSSELAKRCLKILPADLDNLYGPTEAAVDVTFWKCDRQHDEQPIPIGRPIANTAVYIVDSAGNLVPPGVAGELCIGGVAPARGYWRRADITAERFVPDPFGSPGDRLYCTGDLARHRNDGAIEYLGRLDTQVKLRGLRVELGEIEAALRQHPQVVDAAVIDHTHESGSRQLIAYVRCDSAPAELSTSLRDLLRRQLPEYMVPSAFVPLRKFPLSSNGKLDRRALPPPPSSSTATRFEAPRTLAEEQLAEIWTQILGVAIVGIDDSFFDLGGDSIRGIQLVRFAKERGLPLSIALLFRYPTIRQLAALSQLTTTKDETSPPQRFGLAPQGDRAMLDEQLEDAYPLTRLQAGLVYESEASDDYAVYTTSLKLQGLFDENNLNKAVRCAVAQHPSLRTSFDLVQHSVPLQLVHQQAELCLRVEDLRGVALDEQQNAFAAWLAGEQRSRFDWSRAPLVRLHVHRWTDSIFQLTLTEPFFDGWSVARTLTDIVDYYITLQAGRRVEPVQLACSPRDHVALELDALTSEEEWKYWQQTLESLKPCSLVQVMTPASREARARVRRHIVPVSQELSDGLRRIAREASVPLKSVVLAAHLKVLAAATGGEDVAVGVLMNGRPERADGDRIVGNFLTTTPLRFRFGSETWLELVRETFMAEQAILPHRWYPMAEIQRRLGRGRLFDTVFNFTHFHAYEPLRQSTGIKLLEILANDHDYFPLILQCNVDHRSHCLQFAIDYREAEVLGEHAAALADIHLAILDRMVSDSHRSHREMLIDLTSLPKSSSFEQRVDVIHTSDFGRVVLAAVPHEIEDLEPPRIRSEVEQRIAEIWADVLKVDAIGIHQRFVDVGGHSLLATQVVSRIRQAFGLPLTIRSFIDAQTVAEMARVVEALRAESDQIDTELAQALDEIEALSDLEVRERLDEARLFQASQAQQEKSEPKRR